MASEGTYEYECMRAELLGIEKPTYEEYLKNRPETYLDEETKNLEEADLQEEQMKHVSGGLDELNNILKVTQRKINNFKANCGSFTNLLKMRMKYGSTSSTNDNDSNVAVTSQGVDDMTSSTTTTIAPSSEPAIQKSDLAKALDSHVDCLDSMINKAENAQYSMQYQRKEMQKFLN